VTLHVVQIHNVVLIYSGFPIPTTQQCKSVLVITGRVTRKSAQWKVYDVVCINFAEYY